MLRLETTTIFQTSQRKKIYLSYVFIPQLFHNVKNQYYSFVV